MNIALLQMRVEPGAPDKNRGRAERLIETAMRQSPDVVVLPEMWNTGFFPADVAERADAHEETRAFVAAAAAKFGVHIVGGSAAAHTADGLCNVSYVADRTGAIVAEYRKAHLFSPSGEDRVFRRGGAPCIFELEGVRAAVVICYDIRFCEWIRLLALEGAELLFVPAAWPHPRLAHWRTLLRARALENQCFVAAVNQSGEMNRLHFCGSSALIDPWGETLAEAGEAEAVVCASLDFAALRESRVKINVFGDRRADLYRLERR